MANIEGDPMSFYERPYVLSQDEARDFGHLHLSPEEAHYIILDSINNDANIPSDVLNVLREIRDSDEGGDFAGMLNKLDNY